MDGATPVKVERALELLISPHWRELSVGSQTLGQWVAGRGIKSDRCPFSGAVELRVGRYFTGLLPELQVRADAMSFHLWERLGLPLHSRANVCVANGLQALEYAVLWQGELLHSGLVADGDNCSVLIQAVTWALERNAARLLGAKQLDEWLRLLARRHPKLVGLARRRVKREELQRVLQSLLDERASIRRLDVILAVLLEEPVSPLEAVRLALAGDIVSAFAPEFLNVISIIPRLEHRMVAGDFRDFLRLLEPEMEGFRGRRDLALVCAIHDLRFRLRKIVSKDYPELVVMSWREVALGGVNVNSVAMLRSAADKQRSEESMLRYDRKRLRRKESRDEALARFQAESTARVRAPFA